MMPGGIFDRAAKCKGFIWFLIATNFFYFTQLNVLVNGCYLVITPKPRLSRLLSAAHQVAQRVLTPESAEASVIPGAIELVSMSDTPDPFSPDANGRGDTVLVEARFRLDAQKLRDFQNQAGHPVQYFLDWRWQIAPEVIALGRLNPIVTASSALSAAVQETFVVDGKGGTSADHGLYWLAREGDTTPSITVHLPEAVPASGVRLFNTPDERGTEIFSLSVSADGVNFELIGTDTLIKNDMRTPKDVLFPTRMIRAVRVAVNTFYDGAGGLGEVYLLYSSNDTAALVPDSLTLAFSRQRTSIAPEIISSGPADVSAFFRWDGRGADGNFLGETTHVYKVQGQILTAVDDSAPVITLTNIEDGECVNTRELRITGFLNEPGTISFNGSAPVAVDPVDRSFVSGTFPIVEGGNNFSLIATDVFGHTSRLDLTVTGDFVSPVARWITPADGATVNSRALEFEAEVSDDRCGVDTEGIWILVNDDAQMVDDVSQVFTDNLHIRLTGKIRLTSGLLVGGNSIELRIADHAGNPATARLTLIAAPSAILAPAGAGAIFGEVRDANSGLPVSNASVTLDGVEGGVTSGGDGSFTLKMPTARTVAVRVEKSGYSRVRQYAQVNPGHSRRLDPVYIVPLETISDTVVGKFGGSAALGGGAVRFDFPKKSFHGQIPVRVAVYNNLENLPVRPPLDAAVIQEVEARPIGIEFAAPPAIFFKNSAAASPGVRFPVESWDDVKQMWVEQPSANLTADAAFFTAPVHRFQTVSLLSLSPNYPGSRKEEIVSTLGGGGGGDGVQGVSYSEGFLTHTLSIPWTRVLGQDLSIGLVYMSNTADPTQAFSVVKTVQKDVDRRPDHVDVKISMEDALIEKRFFGKTGASAYNFLWDAFVPSQFEKMKTGMYRYETRIDDAFAGMNLISSPGLSRTSQVQLPITADGKTVYRSALKNRILLNNRSASPFGRGWWMQGVDKLSFDADATPFVLNASGTPRFFIEEFHDTPADKLAVPSNIFPSASGPDGRLYAFSRDGGLYASSDTDRTFVRLAANLGELGDLVVAGRNSDRLVLLQHGSTHRLIVTDTQGQILRYIALSAPQNLAVDAKGLVYVADGRRVFVADVDRGSLDLFTANPLPDDASGIGIGPEGYVIVAVIGGVVYRLDRFQNLTELARIPANPGKLRVDGNGNVFVSEIRIVCGAVSCGVFPGNRLFIISPYGDMVPYLELSYDFDNFYLTPDTLYLPGQQPGEIGLFTRKGHFEEIDPQRHSFAHIRLTADGRYEMTEKDLSRKIFDAYGNHVESVDPNGNRTALAYDDPAAAVPLLASITNAVGQTVSFSYTNGRLARVVDHAGRVTTLATNADGDLLSAALPGGATWGFAYEGRGRMVTKTDPRGAQTTYVYDAFGRVKERINPLGQRSRFEPQEVQSLINVVPPTVGTRDNPAFAPDLPVCRYTDQKNATRTIRHGNFGLPVRTTEPDGLTTVTRRDASGRPTVIDRPTEDDRAFFYVTDKGCGCGDVGRIDEGRATGEPPVIVTSDVRSSQFFQYDPRHHKVTQSVDPLGRATSTVYDAAGNPVRIVDADSKVTEIEYDNRGLVLLIRDPTGKETRFQYDAFGNTDQTVDPLGNITKLIYTPTGNVNEVADPAGRKTKFEYDESDKLTAVIDPNGKRTTYEYDLSGNLTKITDALLHVTQFFYDKENRLTRRINATSQEENFVYDAAGNLVEKTKADGTHISFHYDQNNRLIEKITPDDNVLFAYDRFGRLIEVKDNDSRLRMEYDAQNRVARQYQAGFTAYEFSIKYDYDLIGNRVAMRHSEMPPGTRTTYQYDTQNRVTRIADQYGEKIDFSYDSTGNRTRMARDDGRLVSTWAYDAKNRVTDIDHNFDGAVKSFFRYEYNKNDNRTSMTDRYGVRNYAYDDLDRLTGVDFIPDPLSPQSSALSPSLSEHFSYDPVGNRTADARTDTYSYDPANRIQTDGIFTYSFDASGNMTEKRLIASLNSSPPAGEAGWGADTPARIKYVYDAEDRLIRVDIFNSGAGQGPIPDKTVRFRYDGLGRRIEKTVFNGVTQGDINTYFYDEEDIVSRRVTPASPVRWLKRPNVGEIRAAERVGQTVYHATDHGVVLMNAADGSERRWDVSSGHLKNDSVRDIFFYDATQDTWNRSGMGRSWALSGDFPEKSLIVATDREVAIINLATEQVYMRFERGEDNALTDTVPDKYVENIIGGVNNNKRLWPANPPWTVPANLENDRRRPHQVAMVEGKLIVAFMVESVDLNHIEDRNIDGNLGDAKEKESLIRMAPGGSVEMFDFVNDKIYLKLAGENTLKPGAFTGILQFDKPIFRWYRGGIADANFSLGFDRVVEDVFGGMNLEWEWIRDMKTLRGPTGLRFLKVLTKEAGVADNDRVTTGYGAGSIYLFPAESDTRLSTLFVQRGMGGMTPILEDAEVTSRGEIYSAAPRFKDGSAPVFFLPSTDSDFGVDTDIYNLDNVVVAGVANGFVNLMAESSAAHVRAFLQGEIFLGGFSVGVNHFYQHGLAKEATGEKRPKSIEVVEDASDLGSGNHRVFIGSAGGMTLIDESAGNLDFNRPEGLALDTFFPDRGVLPWNRVNKAKYRVYSPRALTDGQMPTDRVDQILALDKDHVIIIQHGGYGQGDAPTVALLDLTALQSERREFFTHGPTDITNGAKGIDEPLILHVENPTTKEIKSDYYLSDALGSITELLAKDATIDAELFYSSFGKIVHNSGTALDQPYSFTGREFDREIGLLFYQSRYYDPVLGRFLQTDEYPPYRREPKTFNLYAYVSNNPLDRTDPTGHYSLTELAVTGAIAGGVASGYMSVISAIQSAEEISILQKIQAIAFDAAMGSIAGATIGITAGSIAAEYAATAVVASQLSKVTSTFRYVQFKASIYPALQWFGGTALGKFVNTGQTFRVGFSRDGGELVYRMAGSFVEKYFGTPHVILGRFGAL